MVGRSNARDQREELDAHRAVGPGAGQRLVVGGAHLGEGGYTDNAAAVASVYLNKLTSKQADKQQANKQTSNAGLIAHGWWLVAHEHGCERVRRGPPRLPHAIAPERGGRQVTLRRGVVAR